MGDKPLVLEPGSQGLFSIEKHPRSIFIGFLKYLAQKNVGYIKNNKPPGLTPVSTLGNIFFCTVKHMDEIVFKKDFEKFPFHSFFIKDHSMSYLDDSFKSIERIGGTVSYLEGELAQQMA
jgi:hypothetical protein